MNASFLWALVPDASEESKWNLTRIYRRELLSRCDWTQVSDVALALEEKEAWAAYRQALRNIPQEFDLAEDVIFPEEPA
jgi:Phage tail assembly chaperone protein